MKVKDKWNVVKEGKEHFEMVVVDSKVSYSKFFGFIVVILNHLSSLLGFHFEKGCSSYLSCLLIFPFYLSCFIFSNGCTFDVLLFLIGSSSEQLQILFMISILVTNHYKSLFCDISIYFINININMKDIIFQNLWDDKHKTD
jgi:hypothetical protein